ncbi:MAG TPA: hypothetical protein VI408_11945, partial [Gaiellaceae bacterium]
MLLPAVLADAPLVRLAGVAVAGVLALAAGASAFIPLAVRAHRAALPPLFAGTTSVYAVPVAGGRPREVLRLHGQWAFPVAAPDGSALVLERPSTASTGVWRVPLDGAAPTKVGELARFTAPVVGSYRAIERESRPAAGWRVDLVMRHAARVVWTRRMPFPVSPVSASPDGATVAVARLGRLELWRAGGAPRVLARGGVYTAPAWSSDGRTLVYFVGGRLVRQQVRSGALRVLARGRYSMPALSR